jgi:hypothetical protein
MSQNFIDQILNRKAWEKEAEAAADAASEQVADVVPMDKPAPAPEPQPVVYDHEAGWDFDNDRKESELDDDRRAAWAHMSDVDLARTLNDEGAIYNEALQIIKSGRLRMREIVVEASRRGVSTMTLHRLTALSRPTIESWRTEAGFPSGAGRSLPLGDVSDPAGIQKV